MAHTKQHKMQQAAAGKKRKSGKWYPGKLISERRAKRKKEGKWVLGEKLTKVGRKRASKRTQVKRLAKAYRSQKKTDQPDISAAGTWAKSKAAHMIKTSKGPGKTGKGGRSISEGGAGHVRKGAVGVKSTKGGEFVKYGKKSKAAGSFRSAFKKGCGASEAGSFTWDGRKYSCKRSAPAKKVVKSSSKAM